MGTTKENDVRYRTAEYIEVSTEKQILTRCGGESFTTRDAMQHLLYSFRFRVLILARFQTELLPDAVHCAYGKPIVRLLLWIPFLNLSCVFVYELN